MDVELADERVIVLTDRFNLDHAEGRAWAKRADAFGTVARIGGLLNRGGSDDYECVYRERRLQPFWRLHSHAIAVYERTRTYAVPVVAAGAQRDHRRRRPPGRGWVVPISGLESCREENERDILFDGLTRAENPALADYSASRAPRPTPQHLAQATEAGTVVVPPALEVVGAGPRGGVRGDRPDRGRPDPGGAGDRRRRRSGLPAGLRLPLSPCRQGSGDRVRRADRRGPRRGGAPSSSTSARSSSPGSCSTPGSRRSICSSRAPSWPGSWSSTASSG